MVAATVTASATVAASAATLVAATVTASATVAASATTLVASAVTASAVAASAATLVAATVAELALRASAAKTVVARSALALKTANLVVYGIELDLHAFDLGSVEGHLNVVNARLRHVKVALFSTTVHALDVVFAEANGFAQKVFE